MSEQAMESRPGPLSGVRVLDLTRAFGGPMATMILGEMGAEVVKIEEPTSGDESRTFPPILKGGVSGYYSSLNRSKKSVTINLKARAGLDLARRLAAESDVLVENFTPGVAERLGLGFDDIKGLKPDIIYCSISGFGQTGPLRDRKGYDPVLQAMGGLMGVTGEKGGAPIKSMVPVADLSAGMFGAQSILAALYARATTGIGQYIDLAMFDVMVSMLSTVGTSYLNTGVVPERSGTENPARVPSAAFLCKGGGFIQVVPNQRQWRLFCDLVGTPEMGDDPRFATVVSRIEHQGEVYARLRVAFEARTAEDWDALFLEAGIPAGPILTLDEIFDSPQVAARDMVANWRDPLVGLVRGINLPFRFSQTPVAMRGSPPALGADTETVLGGRLGLGSEEIEKLRKDNVL